ncbi:MAG: glucarate dehydratase, partial [Actinomycetota bacterium]|nr:glucarate dehydratase [Actinomycetota bacterium]
RRTGGRRATVAPRRCRRCARLARGSLSSNHVDISLAVFTHTGAAAPRRASCTSNGLDARDDSIGTQHYIDGWSFDPKRPCLVR